MDGAFTRDRLLRELGSVGVSFAIVAFLVIALIALYQGASWAWQELPRQMIASATPDPNNPNKLLELETAARATVSQTVLGAVALAGIAAALWNAWVAQRNMRVAERGQITERFTRAIEHLGSNTVEVRVSGIQALAGIAREWGHSQRAVDEWTVSQILAAFVRERARLKRRRRRARPASDVQGALTALGQRRVNARPGQQIDLRDTDLRGADLYAANLQYVKLLNVRLEEATLRRAKLKEALLYGVRFKGARFEGADLTDAYLRDTDLSGALELTQAQINSVQEWDGDMKWPSYRTPPAWWEPGKPRRDRA